MNVMHPAPWYKFLFTGIIFKVFGLCSSSFQNTGLEFNFFVSFIQIMPRRFSLLLMKETQICCNRRGD